ncbi:hypothetical protein TIFTF001_033011 [Ficus carica]|uniref:NAD(+) diphosphatase n=1 Tax=Ficus carica TaxID=3494 RepID=A0AA88J8N2_FICCA|nr:hypothetical protein TIFTF001_033011 [Ficus carica]
MSISLRSHAFAGNPLRSKTPKSGDPFSPSQALETLKTRLLERTHVAVSPDFKVLPFRKGRPLAAAAAAQEEGGIWKLGWIGLWECKEMLAKSGVEMVGESVVYLGSRGEDDVVYWAVDVSGESGGLVAELGGRRLSFVELRTLMVATDWADEDAMGQLAIAGHARSLLEWHNVSKFCGRCGEKTVPKEAGRRKQCSRFFSLLKDNYVMLLNCDTALDFSTDTPSAQVVIMLVIDKENDRALLSRQSRFVPRMWSCLAGFIEPGESLEEAVRREAWEETGIEVGEVVYHSSQPWPVGPSSIPCQLMIGFFAYAKSLEINVDKEELEDAEWHSREDVKRALLAAEYKKAQITAAAKVEQMCKGVEKGQNLAADFKVESGELAPMFFPSPFAIAHHLISSWAFQDAKDSDQARLKQPAGSFSNL